MQTPPTVMIIDDNPLVQESYQALLEAEGFSVVGASNGAEAVLWFQRGRVDLVLLDLNMPVMDGRTFLEYRVRQAKIREVPVLVVSSWLDEPGTRETLLRLGADRLLQKPARREELLGTMRELLAKPRASEVPPSRDAEESTGRQDGRVSFTLPIRVRTVHSFEAAGRLCDLSAGGLGAYLPHRLTEGERITVSLDIEGRSLALTGFVQWAAENETDMGCRHGIRFAEKQEHSFPLYTYSFFREHTDASN